MSEQQPVMPQDLQQFQKLEAKNFVNGANHVYGVDAAGKKTHLKGDDVLAAYGYEDVQAELGDEANESPQTPETSPRDELIDEYAEALKKGETDLSFSDWTLKQERKKQAPWYTNTRAHGEYDEADDARAGEIQDRLDALTRKDLSGGLSKEESDEMNSLIDQLNGLEDGQPNADRKLQEKLKGAPSEDDVEYYRWLKDQTGKAEGGKDDGADNTEEVPVINPEIPLPEEMSGRLTDARDRYCRLTASRRGRIGRKDEKELDEAYQEYMDALSEAGGWIAGQIQDNPEYKDRFSNTLRELSLMGAVVELHAQQGLIGEYRTEQSEGKRFKRFYNMWAGWGGRVFERDEEGQWHVNGKNLVNRAKKVATMTVIGMPLGVVAGAVGVAAAGPIAGGLVAGAVAKGISKGLAGAKINKEADATANVARAQRNAHFAEASQTIVDKANDDENWTPQAGDVIDPSMDKTRGEVRRNRQRVGASAVAGAIGGAVAAEIGGAIFGDDDTLHAKGKPFNGPDLETPNFKPDVPTDLPGGDGRFPWTVWTEKIGSNGTPKIMELVQKGESMGIHFEGNGQGGGAGAIEWVRLPNGTVYNDIPHINAYLEYVNTH